MDVLVEIPTAESDGGVTEANNLITLCWFHHHIIIHGHGSTIDPTSRPQRIRFLPPPLLPRSPLHP